MLNRVLLIALFCSLQACHTIYFDKGNTEDLSIDTSKWHHVGGGFGLMEFSKPYDPNASCNGEWTSIKVEKNLLTGIVSAVVPYGLYSPWHVGAQCSK